jgi:hypothetical protein
MNIIYSTFALFGLASFALAQQAPESVSIRVIMTFDYPGTGNSTEPQTINDGRDIVGSYVDSSGVWRGFVRFSNGNFSAPIVDPNDTCNFTFGRGINNSRLICGSYSSGADCATAPMHGFFLMGHNFSDFDVPGFVDTQLLGVNNICDFAGAVDDGTGFGPAFVSIAATITTFNVPGAIGTAAYQLNSSNQTEGYYLDSSGFAHGFWRDSDGTLHFPIDAPGSIFTVLFGNNDSNWMVGRYGDSGGITHGLFFVPPNRFVTFDYPGSTFTSLNGINAQGFICGRYLDASGIEHGIIARARIGAAANEAGTDMKAQDSPSDVTPVNPPSLVKPVNRSPSAL